MSEHAQTDPDRNCTRCPRLVAFREANKIKFPDFFNGAVPSFGPESAELLIVGMAPGLKGANWSGRPFTGDYAGDLLYDCLIETGFADGTYGRDPRDGLRLINCRITNAVRCVPPQNKVIGDEVNQCKPFLLKTIAAMPNLKCLLILGKVAHDAVLKVMGYTLSHYKFTHTGLHVLNDQLTMVGSYHCSRYNVNTGRLTRPMFMDALNKCEQVLTHDS